MRGREKPSPIDTPHERLETLFLRIVEEAHAQQVETSGSAPGGEIAGFLGEEASAANLLDALVHTEPLAAATPEPPETPRRRDTSDADLLEQLTQPARPPAAEPPAATNSDRPAAPPPPVRDVDRSILEGLTGDDAKRDEERS